jgi:hypothetical protein
MGDYYKTKCHIAYTMRLMVRDICFDSIINFVIVFNKIIIIIYRSIVLNHDLILTQTCFNSALTSSPRGAYIPCCRNQRNGLIILPGT